MSDMRLRSSATLMLLMVVFGLGLSSAASAQYPPTTANGRVSRGTVTPGGCVTFSGDGFLPGEPIDVTDNGQPVATVTATTGGTFSVSVCPTVLGVHILRGTSPTHVVTARVTVAAAGLPGTGAANVLPTVAIGLGLVLTGAGIVYLFRRRRVLQFS